MKGELKTLNVTTVIPLAYHMMQKKCRIKINHVISLDGDKNYRIIVVRLIYRYKH